MTPDLPDLITSWASVVAVAVWIVVGLQWLWNGRVYRELLDLKERHELLKLRIDSDMLAAIRAQVAREHAMPERPH